MSQKVEQGPQSLACHRNRCSWLPGTATRQALASVSKLTDHGCNVCFGLLKKPCFNGRPCCPMSAGVPSVSCHRVRHTLSALPLPKPARPTILLTGSKVQPIGDVISPCTSASRDCHRRGWLNYVWKMSANIHICNAFVTTKLLFSPEGECLLRQGSIRPAMT